MSGLKRDKGSLGALAVTAIVVPLLIGATTGYWQYVATAGAVQAVIGLSIGIVYGTAGMLSLCQVSLAAFGAWTVAYISVKTLPIPFPVAIALGGLVAMPIGMLVGLPALRLRGVNLAIVTLGFAVAVATVARVGDVPGGSPTDVVTPPSWLATPYSFFLLAWVSFVVLAFGATFLRRSRTGLGWPSIKRNERATAALGVSVMRTKLTAFAAAGFVAGAGGGLLAGTLGVVDPANFTPLTAITFFALAVMLGTGHWEGAMALGVFNAGSAALFREIGVSPDIASMLFGIGAVQVLSMGGEGFSGDLRRVLRRRFGKVRATLEVEPSALPDEPPPLDKSARPALEISGLTVRYGAVTALDSVDITVPERSVVGLIGPNGAGKSTLVDAVTGFLAAYDGRIAVGGEPIDELTAWRRAHHVRRSFQQDRTIPDLTARDYLTLASDRRIPQQRIDEVLAFVGVATPDVPIERLDVRNRRLLQVASCLVVGAEVVLLDEPAAGLTADESIDFAARIAKIPERFDCSVLLIEHDMDLVRAVCSEVFVLDFGELIASGPTRDVLESRNVAAAYLGEDVVVA
jgi:branched-chain amino acid transport system permease protein